MKLVAVSQRVDYISNRNETRDALDQRLVSFLLNCNLLPIPVPNIMGNLILDWLERLDISGFVLSGGNDLGDIEKRDATERVLLNYAASKSLPVLGICRGMQFMTVWSGGSNKLVQGHVNTNHRVSGHINEIVNSFHSFAADICPKDYQITAKSDDGLIEAFKHCYLPWEGIMWHPERYEHFNKSDIDRVNKLF